MNPLLLLAVQSPAVALAAALALGVAAALATGTRPLRRGGPATTAPTARSAPDVDAARARLLGRVGRAGGSFLGDEGAVVVLDGRAYPAKLEAGAAPPYPGAALRVTGLAGEALRVRPAAAPPPEPGPGPGPAPDLQPDEPA